MSLWFAVAEGRGTTLEAHVIGPFKSKKDFDDNFLNQPHYGLTVAVVGNQDGYPTRAAAQKEADSYNKGDVTSRVTQAGGNTAQSLGVDPTQILNPLAAIAGFFRALADASLWRSIGWLILGAVMIIAGIYLWLKKQDILPDVMPVPVPI